MKEKAKRIVCAKSEIPYTTIKKRKNYREKGEHMQKKEGRWTVEERYWSWLGTIGCKNVLYWTNLRRQCQEKAKFSLHLDQLSVMTTFRNTMPLCYHCELWVQFPGGRYATFFSHVEHEFTWHLLSVTECFHLNHLMATNRYQLTSCALFQYQISWKKSSYKRTVTFTSNNSK